MKEICRYRMGIKSISRYTNFFVCKNFFTPGIWTLLQDSFLFGWSIPNNALTCSHANWV
jgi:hypothetical protein